MIWTQEDEEFKANYLKKYQKRHENHPNSQNGENLSFCDFLQQNGKNIFAEKII